MSAPTCSHPEWISDAKFLHLIGEFADRGVTGMIMRRCASCAGLRLDVHVKGNKTHRILLSRERGDALLAANDAFWKALRTWAGS